MIYAGMFFSETRKSVALKIGGGGGGRFLHNFDTYKPKYITRRCLAVVTMSNLIPRLIKISIQDVSLLPIT
jgi:hypothetical protein